MDSEMMFKLTGEIKKVTEILFPNGKSYKKISISFINSEMEYIFQMQLSDDIRDSVTEDMVGKIATVKGFVKNYLSKSGYVNQSHLIKNIEIKENKEKINW